MNKSTTKKQAAKASTQEQQTWNQITGTMRVYGNTFDGSKKGEKIVKWSGTISGKDRDGDWVNYYLPVKFRGEAEEPDSDGLHTIDIENAFLSCESYVNKKGDTVNNPVLVVTACEVLE